eukprot:256096-Chlamydomonas_euryale.AAC.12
MVDGASTGRASVDMSSVPGGTSARGGGADAHGPPAWPLAEQHGRCPGCADACGFRQCVHAKLVIRSEAGV